MVEHNVALEGRLLGVRFLRLLRHAQNLLNTVHGHLALARVGKDAAQLPDGPEQLPDVGGEDDQPAHGDFPLDGEVHAGQQGQHGLSHGQEIAGGPVHGQQVAELEGLFPEVGGDLFELLYLIFLLPEGPHHPHAGQILLQDGAHLSLGLVGEAEVFDHPAEEQPGEQEQPRDHDHADERDLHVLPEHVQQRNRDRQQRVHHLHELHG